MAISSGGPEALTTTIVASVTVAVVLAADTSEDRMVPSGGAGLAALLSTSALYRSTVVEPGVKDATDQVITFPRRQVTRPQLPPPVMALESTELCSGTLARTVIAPDGVVGWGFESLTV